MFIRLCLTAAVISSLTVSVLPASDVITNSWLVQLTKPLDLRAAQNLFKSSGFSVVSQVVTTTTTTITIASISISIPHIMYCHFY